MTVLMRSHPFGIGGTYGFVAAGGPAAFAGAP